MQLNIMIKLLVLWFKIYGEIGSHFVAAVFGCKYRSTDSLTARVTQIRDVYQDLVSENVLNEILLYFKVFHVTCMTCFCGGYIDGLHSIGEGYAYLWVNALLFSESFKVVICFFLGFVSYLGFCWTLLETFPHAYDFMFEWYPTIPFLDQSSTVTPTPPKISPCDILEWQKCIKQNLIPSKSNHFSSVVLESCFSQHC